MSENAVVKTIRNVFSKNKKIQILDSVSGNIIKAGTTSCQLKIDHGSVYGIAVQLTQSEVRDFWNAYSGKNQMKHIEEWKPIEENYYPLYWGKDKFLGDRMYKHTKVYKKTGTARLCLRKELDGKDIIYGICICSDYSAAEQILHQTYPALYTKKTK